MFVLHTPKFSFSFLLIAIGAIASSIPKRAPLRNLTINKQEYTLTPLAKGDQGGRSRSYDINEEFNGHPAILKLVKKGNSPPEHTQKEAHYAKEVGQTLYYSTTDHPDYYVLVLQNVRHAFPTPDSPDRKFAHEWYILDEKLEANVVVDTMRKNMRQRAMQYVEENKLIMSWWMTFEDLVFIDWAPGYTEESDSEDSDGPDEVAGVEEVSKDQAVATRQIVEFKNEATRTLERNVNLVEFQEILEKHGKSLRENDMPAFNAEKKKLEEEE